MHLSLFYVGVFECDRDTEYTLFISWLVSF